MKQLIILLFIGMMIYGFWGVSFNKQENLENVKDTSQPDSGNSGVETEFIVTGEDVDDPTTSREDAERDPFDN